jgi:hypothetical protein
MQLLNRISAPLVDVFKRVNGAIERDKFYRELKIASEQKPLFLFGGFDEVETISIGSSSFVGHTYYSLGQIKVDRYGRTAEEFPRFDGVRLGQIQPAIGTYEDISIKQRIYGLLKKYEYDVPEGFEFLEKYGSPETCPKPTILEPVERTHHSI